MSGGINAVTLSSDGQIEIWGRHVEQITHVKWWRWHNNEGIWMPESELRDHEQPLVITMAADTGGILRQALLANRDERINAVLTEFGSNVAGALVLRKMKKDESETSWRLLGLKSAQGSSWRREPGGLSAGLHFPDHAVLTPGGKLVLSNIASIKGHKWQLLVW